MKYNVSLSHEAGKELERLDKAIKTQILKKLVELEENPHLGKPLSNVLKNNFSLHVGKYRIIYTIRQRDIVIARVAHRKEAYY